MSGLTSCDFCAKPITTKNKIAKYGRGAIICWDCVKDIMDKVISKF